MSDNTHATTLLTIHRKHPGILPLLFIFILIVLAPTGYAQVFSGSITGSVTDSTGAVVPDADIVVTNTGTNVSYPVKSTGAGAYTAPYLEPGEYSVSATKTGFEKFAESGVHLDPGATVRVDVKLAVGATSSVVQVNAQSLQLQTDNATVAGVTTAAVIDVIPNITNNPLYYVGLQNGVTPAYETSNSQTTSSFGIGVGGRAEESSFGVNGGRALENEIELDGLPIMGQGTNEATILPNLEGIQEVQSITNNFSAEYGHGQGIFSITTKSGTNKFHGEANYENRNEALNANTTFNKAQDIRRSAFKVNNIGGEVDGPIRKDHLFFASSFHWLAYNYGTSTLTGVPTDLERTGDYGQTLVSGANGLPTPARIFNPFSVTEINSNLYQRAEFPTSPNGPGDYIPNPNAVGLALMKLYPEPNNPPTDVYNDNNFKSYVINTTRQETMNNRIDYKRGRHSIYGSGGFDFGTILNPYIWGPGAVKGFNDAPGTISDRNPYAQIGDTVVISPTLFFDVRYGVVRPNAIQYAGNHSGFSNYSGLGIASATQALFAQPGAAPIVSTGSTQANWDSLSTGQFDNKHETQISHTVSGSVTKLHGNWTFKAGGEYHVTLANFTDFEEGSANLGGCCAGDVGGYTAEYINATGQGQGQFNTLPQLNGINAAETLVGEGVWFVRPGANLKPAYAAKYLAFYSENDWKATPKLTLNLGLRWEVQPGITERYNRLAGYDFTKTNSFGSLGAIDFPGTQGYSRNLWNTEWNDWQPRLGFAYQLLPTLVARGGYATTYLPSNSGYFSSPNDFGEATWASGNTGAETYGPNPQGIPTEMITDAAPLVAATLSNPAAPQAYGVGEAYFNRHLKNQIAKQANVFLEKSFGGRSQWLLSTGWSGSYSNHLTTRNLNFENIQNISPSTLASWRSTYISSNGSVNPQTSQIPNPYQPASGTLLPFQGSWASSTVQQYLTMLPYPLLWGGGLNGSTGFASYNALQVHFAHSSKALYLDVNYTWSKDLSFVTTGIEDGQGVNPSGSIGTPDLICNRCNRNYDTYDIPHVITALAVYQSPFGTGQPLALTNRMGRAILGNWSVAPVFKANDGVPVYLGGLSGQFTGRINYAGGKGSVPLVLPKSYQHWYNGATSVTLPCGITVTPSNYTTLKYNLCAFQGPTVTTPNGSTLADEYWYPNGSQTNGNIRGPGRTNVDASLRRTFGLTEGFKLDITAAATDLFNHAERNGVWNGGIGGTDTVNNPAGGQIVGYGSGTYGTNGMGTFDPRQITLTGRILF